MNLPSSTLCRAQEAYHRNRASKANLVNVQIIATGAAIAWEREAVAAERREQRHIDAASLAAIVSPQADASGEARERLFSETPDRGFEDD